jgi:hypothetical protein
LFLVGSQIISLGIAATAFGYSEYFDSKDKTMAWLDRYFTLERGMALGFVLSAICACVLFYLFVSFYWTFLPSVAGDAVRLDIAILSIAGLLLGIQSIFSSFLLSIKYLKVK